MGKRSRMNRSDGTIPLYRQVANVLRARIMSQDDSRRLVLEREYDLCRIHGVSRITISKALDILQAEGLIVRTRRRGTCSVPEAVRRIKQLRQKRVIHVITPWRDYTSAPSNYFGQIYQGILEAVQQVDYLLNIQRLIISQVSMPDEEVRPPPPSTTLGMILLGLMQEPLIQMYAEQPYPVVCLDYWPRRTEADAIVVDCFNEGQQAVEYLLRHGHSHLFYLGNRQPDGQKEVDAELMLAGIQRALDLAHLPTLPAERVRFCTPPAQCPIDSMADWLADLQPRPTAGIVFSSETFDCLVSLLRQRGICCPKDISLVGKFYEGQATKATGMFSSPRTIGELAVERILQRSSSSRSRPVRLSVPSRLHLGATVTYVGSP